MKRTAVVVASLALALLAGAAGAAGAASAPLRVCADPDNLPFSREDGSGFENRIAQLAAQDLHRPLAYAWLPDRRAFVRKTMGAGLCDVIIGVPAAFERTANTRPYYRSTYVWLERARDGAMPTSFDDPRLAQVRIGVQLIGNDMAASPPGAALAGRGLVRNVVGFPIVGERPSAQRMVDALAAGTIDAALVWGPQAGWFAARSPVPLRVAAAAAPADLKAQHFDFAIAMGVRHGDETLRHALDDFIARRHAEIDRILAEYSVPVVAQVTR
jgi:mxaJ protein